MIKELINAIAEGNTLAIEDNFKAVMAQKISDRLDDMRVSVAQNMFGSVNESLDNYSLEDLEDFMMSEDFEQLDELSKKTLGSYVKKASFDNADRSVNYGSGLDNTTKSIHKILKRAKNIDKAVDKLTKESFDLDEAREERGDMGVERSPSGSCRGSSMHSMDIAKQSGYTHAVMHMGTKGGIDSYHTTKTGADKKLTALRKKHGIPDYSERARVVEL